MIRAAAISIHTSPELDRERRTFAAGGGVGVGVDDADALTSVDIDAPELRLAPDLAAPVRAEPVRAEPVVGAEPVPAEPGCAALAWFEPVPALVAADVPGVSLIPWPNRVPEPLEPVGPERAALSGIAYCLAAGLPGSMWTPGGKA